MRFKRICGESDKIELLHKFTKYFTICLKFVFKRPMHRHTAIFIINE